MTPCAEEISHCVRYAEAAIDAAARRCIEQAKFRKAVEEGIAKGLLIRSADYKKACGYRPLTAAEKERLYDRPKGHVAKDMATIESELRCAKRLLARGFPSVLSGRLRGQYVGQLLGRMMRMGLPIRAERESDGSTVYFWEGGE